MSELNSPRIKEAATRPHLVNLEDNLGTFCERADSSKRSYLEFLDLVLDEEEGVRDGRCFRNAPKLSGLLHHKKIDEFDFAFQPDLDRREVRDLASARLDRGSMRLTPSESDEPL